MDDLIASGIRGSNLLYVAFDDLPTLGGLKEPILAIARWHEATITKESYISLARRGQPVFLFLDEVQNLDSWAEQLKSLLDNQPVRALVTGSSSLRIEAGRDSLAGRITSLDLGPLLLREIAQLHHGHVAPPIWGDNGLDGLGDQQFWLKARAQALVEAEPRIKAFEAFSERGAYPIAHENADTPWPELADWLNETVIRRAIQHDLRMGTRGRQRDGKLLEEVFKLCCRYAGQTPGPSVLVPEIQQAYNANIGPQRIFQYLKFLDGTLLIRLIEPLELRLKRAKARPKICLCDHALRASWLREIIPLGQSLSQNPHLSDLAGHIAESTLGYFLASIPSLSISHFPARKNEPEVDFVLTVGTRRIPIEVKYRRRIDPHTDTLGLRAFIERSAYNAPFGILVTLNDDVQVPDPRIIPISLSSLLWMR